MKDLLEKYLIQNNYLNVVAEDLNLQLISHPDYPSIKAITDTLDYFKVDNIAVNVPMEKLRDLPSCFLALLNEKQNHDIVLVKQHGDVITMIYENGKKKKIKTGEFKKFWTGTLVAVERTSKTSMSSSLKIGVLIPLILLGVLGMQLIEFDRVTFILSMLSLTGAYISYLIVKEEMGIHSKFVTKVCGAESNTNSCNKVINSEEGKLFQIFSLSDLCVTFFVSFTLIYTIIGLNYGFAQILLGLSIPIISFSLYQQAFVVLQWCSMCLVITCTIVIEAGIAFLTAPVFELNWPYSIQASFIFLLVFTTWRYVKPLWNEALEGRESKIENLRFKRNQSFFNTLLKQNPIPYPEDFSNSIRMGSAEPVVTLTAVMNPMCGFCVEAFEMYDKILHLHGDSVAVNLVFNVPYQKQDNQAVQMAGQIIGLNNSLGEKIALESLKQWFANRDIDDWRNKYGVLAFNSEIEHQLKNQSDWCKANDVVYTPCSIIDNYVFPMEYKITDLPFLIGDLIVDKQANKELLVVA